MVVDALPPAPPVSPPAYVYAPTDLYPRGEQERALCERASHTDWLYLATTGLLSVGGGWVNSEVKYASSSVVRHIGPAAMGLSIGWLLGGLPLSLSQCESTYVRFPMHEGDVTQRTALAVAMALGSVVLATFTMGIATGPLPKEWSTEERAGRLFVTSGFAFGGALLPYVLPPRSWAAAEKLRRLRFEADDRGLSLGYSYRW